MAITWLSSSTDDTRIIRNEELILLQAKANINIIRAAAGLGSVMLDATNALDQLLHEKRYSLFLEEHQWIDMRHYNKLNGLPLDRAGDAIIEDCTRPETEGAGGKH